MEALLSWGNIFSTPVSAVKPVDSQALISKTPFVPPATRPTGLVEVPVAVEDSAKQKKVEDKDKKKKTHKSRKQDKADHDSKPAKTSVHKPDHKPERRRDRSPSPVRKASSTKAPQSPPVVASSGPESAPQPVLNKGDSSLFPSDHDVTTGNIGAPPSFQSGFGQPSAGACAFPPDGDSEHYEQFTDYPMDRSDSNSGSGEEEEGQLSDSNDTPEQTEDMSYRETVRSVRAFMGWHHIPTFETDYTEPDKPNNPWKGKHPNKPTRISVAMPPDDWLCRKLERLNLTVAEGYPSRSQDSAGLKRDQFVKVPKTQSKWYKMHMLKPEGTQRPGRSVFSWRNTETKVNSQFPRITRAAAYPATGPPSRPILQESLRRWERTAREDSYIINHAAGFNRCSTELQDRMTPNISLLCSKLNKGKTPKEVSNALTDLRDLMAFHQRVSVAMGTSLQHIADSLFVHMTNLVLICRDSYLDFVKTGVKQDTMNLLRNAPLFGYGLFPDAAIVTAEQDITKYEASSVAQGPGPGASRHTAWKGSHRFKPYDRKDRKHASSSDQTTPQQQQQPWRQFSRSRSRGRGRGRGSNPRFSKSLAFKQYK